MFVRERDTGVDKTALRQLWASFLRCSFEGELREGSIGRIIGYGSIIDIDGGVVDSGYNEIADGWIVLTELADVIAD